MPARSRIAAAAATFLLVVPGCSADGGRTGGPDPTYPVATESGPLVHEWTAAPSFAHFVKWSDAAVIGRVVSIGIPFSYTHDGLRFRKAAFAVEEVVYDSPALAVKPGTTLVVRISGDGTATGEAVGGAHPVRQVNELAGPLAPGDRVLWVLGLTEHPTPDEAKTHLPVVVTDFWGSWHIEGKTARNLHPQRTVPLRALVARLRAERATPTDSSVGAVNPLEEPPPAFWPAEPVPYHRFRPPEQGGGAG